MNTKLLLTMAALVISSVSVAQAETNDLQQEQYNFFNQVRQVPARLVTGVDATMPGTQIASPVLVTFDSGTGAKCAATGSAVADLASERARVTVRQITCTYANGATVNSNVDAFAIGKDGLVNISGEVRTKQGGVLARTVAATQVDDSHKEEAMRKYSENRNSIYPVVEVLPNQDITLVFRPNS